MAALACRAQPASSSLDCRPSDPARTSFSSVLMGGQNVNLRLVSSNVSYDGSSLFQADVTVQNLSTQVLGTTDERTVAPEGVRVFFHYGPVVTSGTGSVSVANADGTDAFTAAGQPYFLYPQVLATGVTSAAKNWRFTVPNTVGSFQFTVYVAAPVLNEPGWVQVSPPGPAVSAGGTIQFAATVHGVTGVVLAGSVSWSSSNPSVATIDGGGLMTAVGAGNSTITASNGARTGSAVVVVGSTPGDHTPPVLSNVVFLRRYVQASGTDSIVTTLNAFDTGSGLQKFSWFLGSPTHTPPTRSCGNPFIAFPASNLSLRCRFTVPSTEERGLWQIDSVVIADNSGNRRKLTTADLHAAGWPATYQVIP